MPINERAQALISAGGRRGTAVHEMATLYVEGDLHIVCTPACGECGRGVMNGWLAPYYQGLLDLSQGVKIVEQNILLLGAIPYDDSWIYYGGQADLFVGGQRGVKIVDIKSKGKYSGRVDARDVTRWEMQLSGYCYAANQDPGTIQDQPEVWLLAENAAAKIPIYAALSQWEDMVLAYWGAGVTLDTLLNLLVGGISGIALLCVLMWIDWWRRNR
jgi:hypothetical protein